MLLPVVTRLRKFQSVRHRFKFKRTLMRLVIPINIDKVKFIHEKYEMHFKQFQSYKGNHTHKRRKQMSEDRSKMMYGTYSAFYIEIGYTSVSEFTDA